MTTKHPPGGRLFHALLSFYPGDFRDEYGREMGLVFADRYRDASTTAGARALLWAQVIAGIVREAPKEHARMIAQDLRHAFRTLRLSPLFTASVVITLAFGMGANTAVFSVLDTVVLRTLPVSDPQQLHSVKERSASPLPSSDRYSHPQFERFRAALPTGTAIAAASRVARMQANLGSVPDREVLRVQLVSDDFFTVLGVHATLGRPLQPASDRSDEARLVVISHQFWQQHFAGSPDVLGRTLTIRDTALTIVGVAPPRFQGIWLEVPVDLWAPLRLQHDLGYAQSYHVRDADDTQPWTNQDGIGWLDLFVRAPAGTESAVSSALNGVFQQDLAAEASSIPNEQDRRRKLDRRLALEPMASGFSALRERFTVPLWALLGMACLVLLIASVNTAHLLLARAASRQREMAIRLSLGAGRSRLVHRLMIESTLLVCLAGVAGLALARLSTGLLTHMVTQALPGVTHVSVELDARVLFFTGLMAIATIFIFGLVPALAMVRVNVTDALKATSRSIHGGLGPRVGRTMVILQISLSVLLVLATGLLGRSLQRRLSVDLGFQPQQVLSVELEYARFATADLAAVYARAVSEIEALPGVQSAAVAVCGLAAGCGWFIANLAVEGHQRPPGEQDVVQTNMVTPGYFETIGMRLRAGRTFDERDTEATPNVAVVNEAFVRRYFAGRPVIGQHLGYTELDTSIVGVVADARVTNVKEDAVPFAFFPLQQRLFPATSIEVRTAVTPESLVEPVRAVLTRAAPTLTIERVVPLTRQVQGNLGQERLVLMLTSGYGILALGLAGFGLFSTLSYTVSRRRNELGIRMALGAAPQRVLCGVLTEALVLAAVGIAVSLPLVVAASRLLRNMLFGVTPYDWPTVTGTVVVLGLVAILAGILPAWRASRVDPLTALRLD